MGWQERTLTWLLRLGGVLMSSAVFTIFLPTETMAAIHDRLGLGAFPASPIVEYLTRSISGLYAIHGGLLLVVSRDVRRHAAVVAYLGVCNVLFGIALFAIDLHAGLPTWWTLYEGPPVVLTGIAILWLVRQLKQTVG